MTFNFKYKYNSFYLAQPSIVAMSIVFGCTISQSCAATFDDHSDWFMHEVVAHAPQFDIWFCKCKKGYYNLNDFEDHFRVVHPGDRYDCNYYLLGPARSAAFYCGFCKEVIALANEEWEYSRYEHVGSHFEGWNPQTKPMFMTREDWKFMDIVPH